MARRIVYAQQGDTVDLIAWRHYGADASMTRTVLLENPGLAGLGPVLPIGTKVILPDLPAPAASGIRLWD